jgi:hypothetical protein
VRGEGLKLVEFPSLRSTKKIRKKDAKDGITRWRGVSRGPAQYEVTELQVYD